MIFRRDCVSRCALLHQFRQPEIQNLHLPAAGYEDVGRLDVPVHNPGGVGRVQPVRDLNTQIEDFLDLQAAVLDVVLQGLPREQLHGDEMQAGVLADLVDGADVGMIERGGRARLALKTLDCQGIAGECRRQKLERDLAAQPRVVCLVDHPHAAATQLLQHAVMAYCRSNLNRVHVRESYWQRWVTVKSQAIGLRSMDPWAAFVVMVLASSGYNVANVGFHDACREALHRIQPAL